MQDKRQMVAAMFARNGKRRADRRMRATQQPETRKQQPKNWRERFNN